MDTIFKIDAPDIYQTAIFELLKLDLKSSPYINDKIESYHIEAAKEDLRKLLIRYNFDINDVSEEILRRNWDKEKAMQFVTLLERNKTNLYHSVITHYNSTYGDTVNDCKWLLKLVLGTSELKFIRYPIMQFVLSTVNSNGQPNLELYELNKETLFNLITNLEQSLDFSTV